MSTILIGALCALGGAAVMAYLANRNGTHTSHAWTDVDWTTQDWDAYRRKVSSGGRGGPRYKTSSSKLTIRRGMKQRCQIENCMEKRTVMRDYVDIKVDELERLHEEEA